MTSLFFGLQALLLAYLLWRLSRKEKNFLKAINKTNRDAKGDRMDILPRTQWSRYSRKRHSQARTTHLAAW